MGPASCSGEVRPFAGVIEHRRNRDVAKRHRLDAAAAHILFSQRLVAAVLERKLLERV